MRGLSGFYAAICQNLAKLGGGLDESPTVMVGEAKNNSVKIEAN